MHTESHISRFIKKNFEAQLASQTGEFFPAPKLQLACTNGEFFLSLLQQQVACKAGCALLPGTRQFDWRFPHAWRNRQWGWRVPQCSKLAIANGGLLRGPCSLREKQPLPVKFLKMTLVWEKFCKSTPSGEIFLLGSMGT